MAKEELEQEAEAFVSEKVDKGNFDVEKFGKAYFSESSMKQALVKFAEPKIQRILELEQRITELEKKYSYSNKAWNELVEEWKKDYNELKKKNDALKKRVCKQSDELYNRFAETEFHKENNERHYKQLIEAKEIIKELLDTQSQLDPYRNIFKDRILKAEKFLSEVEK